MKKITISFPNEMPEEEVIRYIPATFDNNASHFREMEIDGVPNNIIFSTGTKATLTRSKTGYALKITELAKAEESKA